MSVPIVSLRERLMIMAADPFGNVQYTYAPNHFYLDRLLGSAPGTYGTLTVGMPPIRCGPIDRSEMKRLERETIDWVDVSLELGVYKRLPVEWLVDVAEVQPDPKNSRVSLATVLNYGRYQSNLLYVQLYPSPARLCKLVEHSEVFETANARLRVNATFRQCAPSRDPIGTGNNQPYGSMDYQGW